MQKHSSLLLAAIGGLIGGFMPTGTEPSTPGGRRFAKPSKRYPEQSSRQAMRGHRRAQGGPGIELNSRTHEYQPRYF